MNAESADLLLEHMRGLQAAFDAKIRYDEVRERLVESMSEELAAHRQGLFQMQLRPLLHDLIQMHDDLTKMSESADSRPETVHALGLFRDTVEQALARNGVERYTVDGDTVDRARQKVISVVDTPDPAADRQLARRLRPGFTWNGAVLRPEWVSAYRHVAALPEEKAQSAAGVERDGTARPVEMAHIASRAEEGAPS
jgi:molecular chaperone GrpE (heat shock protein)